MRQLGSPVPSADTQREREAADHGWEHRDVGRLHSQLCGRGEVAAHPGRNRTGPSWPPRSLEHAARQKRSSQGQPQPRCRSGKGQAFGALLRRPRLGLYPCSPLPCHPPLFLQLLPSQAPSSGPTLKVPSPGAALTPLSEVSLLHPPSTASVVLPQH